MKDNPDITIDFYTKEIYRTKLKNKSGIYIYTYDKRNMYVGASKDLGTRAFRIYRKKIYSAICSGMADYILKHNIKHIKINVFRHPINSLKNLEKSYIKKFKPIFQVGRFSPSYTFDTKSIACSRYKRYN